MSDVVWSSVIDPSSGREVRDDISLEIDGQRFRGWKRVRITRGIDQLASAFSVFIGRKVPDGGDLSYPVGASVVVRIGDDVVLTGWIEEVSPAAGYQEDGVDLVGRSRAGDLVDCSAINAPGQWSEVLIEDIIRDLCAPFGIRVFSPAEGTGEKIDNFEIEKGETVYECIERLCRLRSLLARDTPGGDIRLARVGKRRAQGTLQRVSDPERRGRNNIQAGRGKFGTGGRFSELRVSGQQSGDDQVYGEEAAQSFAVISDKAVGRYRPKLMLADGAATSDDCRKIGNWEASRAAGRAQEASFKVIGWRQSPYGALWDVDLLIPVEDHYLSSGRFEMLGSSLSFVADGESRYSEISLQPAESFDPKPVSGAETLNMWRDVKPLKRG
ncbi:phage baseplate assembly protein [Kiloniella laminariae]|uniref:phage baseplate assembly protein n=1 Tax=Kiloniella laminariae TaxID=454162 RepID=UPI00035E4986|nr:hypothetical protein [Kiloniella laminariae]